MFMRIKELTKFEGEGRNESLIAFKILTVLPLSKRNQDQFHFRTVVISNISVPLPHHPFFDSGKQNLSYLFID